MASAHRPSPAAAGAHAEPAATAQPRAESEGAAVGSYTAGAAQRVFHEGIQSSPHLTAQRATAERLHDSRPMALQRQRLEPLHGSSGATPATRAPADAAQSATPRPFVPGGLPAQLRAGIEALSGMDLGDVRVHRNSGRPAQLQAQAFAQGNDIHIAPGQERHLPHEAWHVVQQRQGRVHATVQAKGVGINDDPALESEADRMGAQALQTRPESAPAQRRAASGSHTAASARAPVQRAYADLNAMGKARVDQQAERDYARKALEFELGMAPIILADASVNATVDLLVGRVRRIVDAWAHHTARAAAVTYEREFGWPPGDGYYGAFEATAANITAILTDTHKPMRMKLKLVYNAVRNGNLAKWLKVAALELDRLAHGQAARNWRVRSDAHRAVFSPAGAGVQKTTHDHTVTAGFAATSGLNLWLPAAKVPEIAATARRERQSTGWFAATKREIFTHEQRSDVHGWHESTRKANAERRGQASRGLPLAEQRTLQIADVPDLTDEEVDLILKRRGNPAPNGPARAAYRGAAGNPVPWSQGGEFFDVELGSESARAAAEIKARMEAGISGSTDLMLHAAQNLGLNGDGIMKGLRLALAGWMMANRDHSFYEVYEAAAAYDVLFEKDDADPGMEYESAENLAPMFRHEFAGILPADGVLPGANPDVFPKDYLSMTWKDALANALGNPGDTQDQIKTVLRGRGVSDISQSVMTPRDTAALQQLDEFVQAHPAIDPAATAARKRQILRRIRQQPAYIYLGNVFGEVGAARMLDSLLLAHHPGANIAPDDTRTRLINAGIPSVIVDFVPALERARLEALRAAVQAAAVDPVDGLDMGPIDATLVGTTLSALQQTQVKAALIRKYHGDAHVPALDRPQADVLNRIAQVEEIAGMQKTTGTWYTWGPRAGHQQKIAAASLREATADVPSQQGPGLYIGRKITTSSAYGANLGLRAMAAKMDGVPTIDQRNPEQMRRLRLASGAVGGHPLESAGLFSPLVRTEFLMIYGGGNFARLTTKNGVLLTMDLKRAPADEMRAEYQQPGHWSGNSRTNFQQQAAESGLDISTW